jgi:hypothetical protein
MRRARIAVTAALLAACSSGTTAPVLPACTWPASLNPPDPGVSGWSVGRTILQCGRGTMEVCASDSETTCPSGGGGVNPGGASLEPCVDVCKANEYGLMVSNGGGGISATADSTSATVGPNAPSSCYSPTGIPAFSDAHALCCPCE